jgi:Undecaprenyl-phosphate glucose phosphotransferase
VSGQVIYEGVFSARAKGAPARTRTKALLGRCHPAALLAGWHMAIIILSGLACRQLNPAGHAGHTQRELLVIAGTAVLAVFLLHRRGLYAQLGERVPRAWLALLMPVLRAFSLMLLALLFWEGITALWQGPVTSSILTNRNWLFAWAVTAPSLLLLSREAVEAALLRSAPPRTGRRAIVLGKGHGAVRLAAFLAGQETVQIVGYVGFDGGLPEGAGGWPVLRSLRAACALIQAGGADLVIIALPEAASHRIAAIVRRMSGMAVDIRLAPDTARFYRPDARVSSIGGLPFLHLCDKPISGIAAAAKRAEDLALGVPLLCLAAPLMLLVALAIRLDSPGPVLFVQPRMGFNNRIIRVRKFRTMHGAASDAGGSRQAVRGDLRVTRVGRWLRRTSLDELPQLLDVLAGSMSLVGPRPHALGTAAAGLPFETAADDYESRHRVKPGITGWAQVRGWRGETDTVEKLRCRVEHDLHYIAHWSLWFDLRILVLTVTALFQGEAY